MRTPRIGTKVERAFVPDLDAILARRDVRSVSEDAVGPQDALVRIDRDQVALVAAGGEVRLVHAAIGLLPRAAQHPARIVWNRGLGAFAQAPCLDRLDIDLRQVDEGPRARARLGGGPIQVRGVAIGCRGLRRRTVARDRVTTRVGSRRGGIADTVGRRLRSTRRDRT